MPNRKEDMPGKLEASAKQRQELRKLQRERRTREVYSEKWPSSKYDAESEYMATASDEDYIHFDIRYCTDPQYVVDAILEAIYLGHKSGNWDELVAGQQTGFDNYCQDLIEFCCNFTPMNVMHDFLKALPITATATNLTIGDGQTGNVTVPLLKKTSIDEYIKDFQNADLFIPKYIKYLIPKVMGTVWEVTKEWNQGGIDIPGSYYYNFVPKLGGDALDVLMANLKSNSVNASKYMNQFGIPGEPLDKSLFEYSVKPLDPQNPEVIAWFSEMPYAVYYDAASNVLHPSYAIDTANYALHRYWHKHGGSMNDAEFYDFSRHLYPRHVTYNKYGGMFSVEAPATAGYASIFKADEPESTELKTGSTMGDPGFMNLFLKYDCTYRFTDIINVSLTGTKVTEADLAINMYAVANDHKFRTGIKYTFADGVLIKNIIEKSGFIAKSKDEPAVKR